MPESTRSRADYKSASRAYYRQTDTPEDHWIVEEAHAQMQAGIAVADIQKNLVAKGAEPAGASATIERAGDLVWSTVLPQASAEFAAGVQESISLGSARTLAKALAGENSMRSAVRKRLLELGASEGLAAHLSDAPEVQPIMRARGWRTVAIGGAFTLFAIWAALFDPAMLTGIAVLPVFLGPAFLAWGLYALAKGSR